MNLWKSLLITSIALTSLNTAAAGSLQNLNQSVKHSALAGSTGLVGSGQVAVSVVTTPVMLIGGTTAEISRGVARGAQHVADESGAPVPFEIGEEVIISSAQ